MTDYVIQIDNDKLTCRICYEEDTINNMIYPCKCDGNMKYVHSTCLNKWRKTNNNRFIKCDICLTEYIIFDRKINLHKIHQIYQKRPIGILTIYLLFIFTVSSILLGCDINKQYAKIFIKEDVDNFIYYRVYFITTFLFLYVINLFIISYTISSNRKRYCINCLCFQKCNISYLYKFLLLFVTIIITFLYTTDFYGLNIAFDIIYSIMIIDLSNRTHISTVNNINESITIEEPVLENYNTH